MQKFFCGAAMFALMATSAPARDLVVHAGTLLDGVNDAARSKVSILIHDDRISAIEPGFVTPAGAEVINLSSVTVMPGFIGPGAIHESEFRHERRSRLPPGWGAEDGRK